MKDAWPVEAQGNGGRHYRGNYIDQNFDSYSTEFTFADGSKLYLEVEHGRCSHPVLDSGARHEGVGDCFVGWPRTVAVTHV